MFDDRDPTYQAYANICVRCPHNEANQSKGNRRACRSHKCDCTINGKWFLDNARAGECPRGMFVLSTDAILRPVIRGIAPTPKPIEEWPVLARLIAARRQPPDRGLGDTIARELDPKGGKLVKRLYKRITGGDCGCSNRQDRLNLAYPY